MVTYAGHNLMYFLFFVKQIENKVIIIEYQDLSIGSAKFLEILHGQRGWYEKFCSIGNTLS
jgi:hypothetical protein